MKKIKMKINGYDEASHSLLISFASDENQSNDPSDYPSYAYQPMSMWPDINDINEIKKRLAQAGIYLTEQQKIKEQFVADQSKVDAYKSMIGEVIEYNLDDLIITPTQEFKNEINL